MMVRTWFIRFLGSRMFLMGVYSRAAVGDNMRDLVSQDRRDAVFILAEWKYTCEHKDFAVVPVRPAVFFQSTASQSTRA